MIPIGGCKIQRQQGYTGKRLRRTWEPSNECEPNRNEQSHQVGGEKILLLINCDSQHKRQWWEDDRSDTKQN